VAPGRRGPVPDRVSAWQALVLLPVGVLLGLAWILAFSAALLAEALREILRR
jgi:hypothetical protein